MGHSGLQMWLLKGCDLEFIRNQAIIVYFFMGNVWDLLWIHFMTSQKIYSATI